ncbi:hypothetical protein MNBD_GAMMA15-1192 [hydrothermal vent metagenome]|uniref:Uncharacterized protein n=1 Tax=hydrothermal vent metagenome TaxID=652676 RepID=A0A3B0YTX9_9ZZZZ
MVTELKKGIAAQTAVCTLIVGSLVLASGASQASGNPFVSTDLSTGYKLVDADTATQKDNAGKKDNEGNCGGKTDGEAVCGMYQVGSSHKDPSRVKDGKCGGHKVVEALCGEPG